MSPFVTTLRDQLVDAAAREAPARRRPRLPVWRIAVAGVAAAAAVLLLVIAIAGLPRDDVPVDTPPPAADDGRPLFGGSLEANVRYRTPSLVPGASFVVPDDRWFVNDTTSTRSLILERRAGTRAPGGESRPVEFLALDRIARVVDPRSGREIPAPADLVAWLARHPDLRAGSPVRTSIAGSGATRIDTTVAFDRPAQPSEMCRRQFMIECTVLAPLMHFANGSRVRWYVLDGGPEPFAITVIGFDRAAFRAALKRTRPILESLRIHR